MKNTNTINLKRQEEIIRYTPGGMHVCYLSDPIHLEYASDGLSRMLGFTKEEFEAHTKDYYCENVLMEDRDLFVDFVSKLGKHYGTKTCEYRMIKKDGSIIYVLDTMESMMCPDGIVRGYSSVTDITAQKKAEEKYRQSLHELQASNSRFHAMLKFAEMLFFEYDPKQERYTDFENLGCVFFYTKEQYDAVIKKVRDPKDRYGKLLGDIYFLVHSEDRKSVQKDAKDLYKKGKIRSEMRILCGDNQYHWFESEMSISKDTPDRILGYMQNIDSRIYEIDALKRQSLIDPMTGVLNKVAAFNEIDSYLTDHPDSTHALLFLDIDDFKIINDKLGHSLGDQVIKYLAGILRSLFRKSDITARFGGDEFIIFMKDITHKEAAFERANALIGRCKDCCCLKDTPLNLSVSIGVAFFQKGMTAWELFEKADQLLYQAKSTHKGCVKGTDD